MRKVSEHDHFPKAQNFCVILNLQKTMKYVKFKTTYKKRDIYFRVKMKTGMTRIT